MTSATGSPTCRTSCSASTWRGGSFIPSMGIRHATVPRPSACASFPVSTATTPGWLFALSTRIFFIRAWACGERRTYACRASFSSKSSVYWPAPLRRRSSSRRAILWPRANLGIAAYDSQRMTEKVEGRGAAALIALGLMTLGGFILAQALGLGEFIGKANVPNAVLGLVGAMFELGGLVLLSRAIGQSMGFARFAGCAIAA